MGLGIWDLGLMTCDESFGIGVLDLGRVIWDLQWFILGFGSWDLGLGIGIWDLGFGLTDDGLCS